MSKSTVANVKPRTVYATRSSSWGCWHGDDCMDSHPLALPGPLWACTIHALWDSWISCIWAANAQSAWATSLGTLTWGWDEGSGVVSWLVCGAAAEPLAKLAMHWASWPSDTLLGAAQGDCLTDGALGLWEAWFWEEEDIDIVLRLAWLANQGWRGVFERLNVFLGITEEGMAGGMLRKRSWTPTHWIWEGGKMELACLGCCRGAWMDSPSCLHLYWELTISTGQLGGHKPQASGLRCIVVIDWVVQTFSDQ